MKRFIVGFMFFVLIGVTAITSDAQSPGTMAGGTGWGAGVFSSNGERIYYTSTTNSGKAIAYSGGPASSDWMITIGQIACVSCHGPSGRGSKHSMGSMTMTAPDIRWSVLQRNRYDSEKFRLALVRGQGPDGKELKQDMPRWKISDSDLADLIAFLKTLP